MSGARVGILDSLSWTCRQVRSYPMVDLYHRSYVVKTRISRIFNLGRLYLLSVGELK